jgi:putative SOS response-associated peptidase YedK
MCGRYELNITPGRIETLFQLKHSPEAIAARYNIAPSQVLPVCRLDKGGGRELASMKWGLIPFWAKDPKIAYKTINARAETVDTSPAFRDAFKSHRCLIPATGFYEWQMRPGAKQPFHIGMQDGEPFAFAGLWSYWKPPEGDPLLTYTIITTHPNELCAKIHDRMPVILDAADYTGWLNDTPDRAQSLLRPYPADEMKAHMVSTRVGNVKNDDADLTEPLGTD